MLLILAFLFLVCFLSVTAISVCLHAVGRSEKKPKTNQQIYNVGEQKTKIYIFILKHVTCSKHIIGDDASWNGGNSTLLYHCIIYGNNYDNYVENAGLAIY